MHPGRLDIDNAGLVVFVIGADMDLPARVGNGRAALLRERHAQERDRHLFAGRQQDIEFPRRGGMRQRFGEREQAVGLAAHGRHHHHDPVARLFGRDNLVRHGLDPLNRANRGTAVFLHYQGHIALSIPYA